MAKTFSIENWHKYQARTDKEMPWCKLWGSLFDRQWWQEMDDEHKVIPIIFFDAARRFNNKMPKNLSYFVRNYNLKVSENDLLKVCKYLQEQGFLSDLVVGHIRVDKIREDKESAAPTSLKTNQDLKALTSQVVKELDPKKVSLKEIVVKCGAEVLGEGAKHKLYNALLRVFERRGWETSLLLDVFKTCSARVGENGYKPKEGLYPYFDAVIGKYVNENAEMLSVESKRIREKNAA